ncbi:MAG: DUF2079 domain-containing protein [Candidatus Tyrphobacter sp.]
MSAFARTARGDGRRAWLSTKTLFLAAVCVFGVAYLALDLNRLYALRYGADLGTYAQTLVNLQHGSSWNYGEWRPHFQVHDAWAISLLAPLVWLFPSSEMLVLIQVAAVACAALVLAAFAREIGVDSRTAAILGVAFLLSPCAQGLVYDNFSDDLFVPLLAFAGALFARRRALVPTLVIAELLLGLKEDQMIFVAWFGAACALWWDRRMGLSLLCLAIANAVGYYAYETLLHVRPHDPSYALVPQHGAGVAWLVLFLLAPFAFAPLAIGWKRWLLALPLVAEVLFMAPWAYDPTRLGSHYPGPLLAAFSIAAAFGALRWPRTIPWMIPLGIVSTLFFNDTVLHVGRWPYVVDWKAYAYALRVRQEPIARTISREREGLWAVAAVNPRVRLEQRPRPGTVYCPAYNRSAAAFFGSLHGRMPPRLCQGVPVDASVPTPAPLP